MVVVVIHVVALLREGTVVKAIIRRTKRINIANVLIGLKALPPLPLNIEKALPTLAGPYGPTPTTPPTVDPIAAALIKALELENLFGD